MLLLWYFPFQHPSSSSALPLWWLQLIEFLIRGLVILCGRVLVEPFTDSRRSGWSQAFSFLALFLSPCLVSDNKPRREAAVAMGVTGTGERCPVVRRRQDGSVVSDTACIVSEAYVCVCVSASVCMSQSLPAVKKTSVHSHFQLPTLIFV